MKIALALSLCVGVVAASSDISGQVAGVTFEVAAIRPGQPDGPNGVSVGLRVQGDRLTVGAYTLRDLLIVAYLVRPFQVAGPDWIGEDRFDVQAKLPAGATATQVPEMLQRLLTERFELKTHREKRQLPVYALVVVKPSARLTENKSGGPIPSHEALANLAVTFNADGVFGNLGDGSSYTFSRKGRFDAKKLSMPVVAAILERFSDRAVLDMTGLVGAYDLSIDVGEENYWPVVLRASINAGVPVGPQNRATVDRAGNPLGDALQQVGLKLDARRAPIDVIVVDAARRTPIDN
jgi:uncharacterized protein (TIGR03435 family)